MNLMIKEPQFIVDPNGNIKGVKKKNQFKDFVIEYFKIILGVLSIFILGLAIGYPLMCTFNDFKEYLWTGWLIYPLAILIMAIANKTDFK